MSTVIRRELAPHIVLLTLTEGVDNALSLQMSRDFARHVQILRTQPPRVIIVTGEGQQFSSGHDRRVFDEVRMQHDTQSRGLIMKNLVSSFIMVLDINVPIIAALNGDAIGAGFYLASACDFRVAVEGSSFGADSLRRGAYPGMASTYFLPRLLGHARAYQLMAGGRITAEEGYRLGFIHEVVAADQLLEKSKELALQLANTAPEAAKHLLMRLRGSYEAIHDTITEESKAQARAVILREFSEGVRAESEGRLANWLTPGALS